MSASRPLAFSGRRRHRALRHSHRSPPSPSVSLLGTRDPVRRRPDARGSTRTRAGSKRGSARGSLRGVPKRPRGAVRPDQRRAERGAGAGSGRPRRVVGVARARRAPGRRRRLGPPGRAGAATHVRPSSGPWRRTSLGAPPSARMRSRTAGRRWTRRRRRAVFGRDAPALERRRRRRVYGRHPQRLVGGAGVPRARAGRRRATCSPPDASYRGGGDARARASSGARRWPCRRSCTAWAGVGAARHAAGAAWWSPRRRSRTGSRSGPSSRGPYWKTRRLSSASRRPPRCSCAPTPLPCAGRRLPQRRARPPLRRVAREGPSVLRAGALAEALARDVRARAG